MRCQSDISVPQFEMTPSRKISIALVTAILLFFATSIVAQYRVEQLRSTIRPQEILYIPSAKTIRRMSLGYTGLMADIYWTRAVQYFGGKHQDSEASYNLLDPLLQITTDLDPHLVVAYRFGGTFLAQNPPHGAGQPDKAVALLEKGIRNNPDDWHLYFDLGFLHSIERKDYLSAAQAFERGSKVPRAHPFLKVLAAVMAQHGGDLQTARLLWQTTLSTTNDAMIKQNAERHLRALEVDEVVPKLEEVIRLYRERTGKQPTNFMQLVAEGYLRRIPVDPLGRTYKLRPDGTVEVQDPDALPFIQKGLPPGYKPRLKSLPQIQM
jgi:hypothetical protein